MPKQFQVGHLTFTELDMQRHHYRVARADGTRLGELAWYYHLKATALQKPYDAGWDYIPVARMAEAIAHGSKDFGWGGLTATDAVALVQAGERLTREQGCREVFHSAGSYPVWRRLTPAQQAVFPAPRYHVGEVVTVLTPWWRPKTPALRCVVVEGGSVYTDSKGYSLTVREEAHPGAHGRSIYESAVEGFNGLIVSQY